MATLAATEAPYPFDHYRPWQPPAEMDGFQQSLVLQGFPAGTRIVEGDSYRHIGFVKFIIWRFDSYGWGSKGGLVERYLYTQDVSRSEFAPRLALRCLWRLQRDSSVAGERDAVQREASLKVLRASLMSLSDVRP